MDQNKNLLYMLTRNKEENRLCRQSQVLVIRSLLRKSSTGIVAKSITWVFLCATNVKFRFIVEPAYSPTPLPGGGGT